MAKAKDLMGRSGASGLSSTPTPAPKPIPQPLDEHKTHADDKAKPAAPGGGSHAGVGKAPVARRPKV